MKIGIIIDSSAGISKKEADKRNWGFLPLYMNIGKKEFIDGETIDSETYYSTIDVSDKVKTSATPIGIAGKLFDQMTKKFDHILVYPLSEELSSQTNNLKKLAEGYKNIHVISSKGVGFAITRDCEELEELAKKKTWDEIKVIADEMTQNQYGIAIPATMEWLVKGGRVGPAAASMANLLKIIPMISFENGKLEKYGKSRIFKKAVIKLTNSLISEIGTKENIEYIIYHGKNENIDEYSQMVNEMLERKVNIHYFPPVIGNHIGPGVFAIITRKKYI